jgi:D-threo-aldose 1-dehydrogenase
MTLPARHPFPSIGLGGAGLGNLYRAISDDQAIATVHAALESGFGLIDTAPYYGHGRSEQRIGHALSARREFRPMISTKVGRILDPVRSLQDAGDFGFADPLPFRPRFDYSRAAVWRSLEESRTRLGVAKFDIVLIHDIGRMTHGAEHPSILRQVLDETLPVLEEARAQGFLDRVGIGVNEWEVCVELLSHAPLDVVLLAGRYTLFEQLALQSGMLDLCAARGVRVLAGGVFNSGLLATRPTAVSHYNYEPAHAPAIERARRLWDVCVEFGVALPAVALQFPAAHPAVATVLAGARSPAEVAEIAAWSRAALPADLWIKLKETGLIARDAPVPEHG